MAETKCIYYPVRTTQRKFTAKDVARIAGYALQAGESEKEIIVRLALKVGYLHDFLVKINNLVQKVEPILIETEDFFATVDDILTRFEKVLSILGAFLVFVPGAGELVISIALLVERIKIFVEKIKITVQDLKDFVDTFDISSIIADSAVAKLT